MEYNFLLQKRHHSSTIKMARKGVVTIKLLSKGEKDKRVDNCICKSSLNNSL